MIIEILNLRNQGIWNLESGILKFWIFTESRIWNLASCENVAGTLQCWKWCPQKASHLFCLICCPRVESFPPTSTTPLTSLSWRLCCMLMTHLCCCWFSFFLWCCWLLLLSVFCFCKMLNGVVGAFAQVRPISEIGQVSRNVTTVFRKCQTKSILVLFQRLPDWLFFSDKKLY